MSESVRKKILKEFSVLVKEAWTKLTVIHINRFHFTDLETEKLPVAMLFSGRETRQEEEIGEETYDWELELEIYGNFDMDTENLLQAISNKIALNETLNGTCHYARRQGSDVLTSDVTKEMKALKIIYQVRYSHLYGEL